MAAALIGGLIGKGSAPSDIGVVELQAQARARLSAQFGVACVDSVAFRSSIKVGQLVTFLASVNYVGDTSVEIGIKIVAEDLVSRRQTHTNSCYVTMVSVDDKGRPRQVPKLILKSVQDKRRNADAQERRSFRLKQLGRN